jgi:hypothetical protein
LTREQLLQILERQQSVIDELRQKITQLDGRTRGEADMYSDEEDSGGIPSSDADSQGSSNSSNGSKSNSSGSGANPLQADGEKNRGKKVPLFHGAFNLSLLVYPCKHMIHLTLV